MYSKQEIIVALEKGWVTKSELQQMLGGCGERAARAFIEELNEELSTTHRCVVSTASRPGYHIPSLASREDRAIVSDAINELRSKAVSIFRRRQILEGYQRYAETVAAKPDIVQLSLF